MGKWVKEQQDKVDKAKAVLQRVRERQWNKKNKHRVPATYQEGDWVLVHHSGLPAWPRSSSDDPYFGPYKILSVDGHRIAVRCSLRLGGTLVCAAQQLKRYYDPEDLCGEEWELNDEENAALNLQGAASPVEVERELSEKNAEEIAKEGFYLVKSVIRYRYRQGWRFLTLWEGFGVEEATWEPFSAFVLPGGRLNSVLVDYVSQNNLGELLRLAETLASRKNLGTEPFLYLPMRVCECADPQDLWASCRNGVLIIPKSAPLLRPAGVLSVPRGTPRVSPPLGAQFLCWHQTSLGEYPAITPRYWLFLPACLLQGGVAKS